MHHRITDMYINFQQKCVSRSVKTVRTNIFAKSCKFHKFATIPIIFFFKSITSDMHHHKTYMYINFQHNRANRSVITVHTNLLFKKIASCINLQLPIEIFKTQLFQTCIIVKRTCKQLSAKSG